MIFIDAQYRCHAEYAEGRRAVDVPVLHGKSPEYVAGWIYVPSGETGELEGLPVHGEAFVNFIPERQLEKAQAAWEHEQLAIVTAQRDGLLEDMQALIDEVLGGEADV